MVVALRPLEEYISLERQASLAVLLGRTRVPQEMLRPVKGMGALRWFYSRTYPVSVVWEATLVVVGSVRLTGRACVTASKVTA